MLSNGDSLKFERRQIPAYRISTVAVVRFHTQSNMINRLENT